MEIYLMRMWMVNPKILCKAHLLGEHGELHKFLHNWRKQHRIDGRIAGNAIEPLSYKSRHDELAKEMIERNYKHNSELEQPDFSYLTDEQLNYRVDLEKSLKLLIEKCPACRERYRDQLKSIN